jgi:Uncharacterised protein family (UPF0158)
MKALVSLKDVVNEMEMQADETEGYLNKRTGELITLLPDELYAVEEDDLDISDYPDWQKEVIAKARDVLDSDDYLTLPSKYDIHEYRIMEEFCYSIEDEELSDKLLDKIRGSGAFRRFKEAVYRLGIEEDWHRFRQDAFEKIAIDWLEEHGIAYNP